MVTRLALSCKLQACNVSEERGCTKRESSVNALAPCIEIFLRQLFLAQWAFNRVWLLVQLHLEVEAWSQSQDRSIVPSYIESDEDSGSVGVGFDLQRLFKALERTEYP